MTRSEAGRGIALTLCILVLCAGTGAAEKAAGGRTPQRLDKTTGSPAYTYLNINRISTVLRSNGIADIDPTQNNSGLVYPRGSSKTAMFQSGLLWAARVAGDPQVRVGGSAYTSGLQPGKLLGPSQSEDPNLDKNRIYRVRPDYRTADLTPEVTDERGTASEIRAQYERDWLEWPATDGAPFTDVNHNGTYEAATDIPGVPGADQTVWFVANDNNPTNVTNLYGAKPLGVEVQVTSWGYAQEGALGNMIFKSYLLINKSTTAFDSMYVCQWSDPDLGNATDDYAGCDTSLSLGFIYNAGNIDATYNNVPPPAAGFDFFQGPRVASPGSTARYRGQDISGYRNLPMTAYFYFINSDPTLADPTRGDQSGSTQFYNFMRGRIGLTGQPFRDPQGNPSSFTLTGDPQTGTGWLDGQQYPAGDRRMGLASGPFTMAPGDTQEIVVAEICAGALPGVDRLSAVGLLKFYDKVAQLAYDNGFRLPSPPPRPTVTTAELDRALVLNWGSDRTAVEATESSNNKGFTFQGYNVYQLPSASASISEARKIAVFDLADGVARITDQVFDPSVGVVTNKVVQLGTDNGIRRSFRVTGDAFNGGNSLVNGIRYYFAVTAYSFSPDPNAVPNNLENPLQVITLVPRSANPGVRYQAGAGDTITAVAHTGPSDGSVIPLIIDPSRTTGHAYRVIFANGASGTTWSVVDQTTRDTLLRDQSNQGGDETYLVVDGIQVKVLGPPPGMKNWSIPSGERRWTFAGGADGFHMEGFSGAIGNGLDNWGAGIPYDRLRNVLLKLAATDVNGNLVDPADTLASFGYRYLRRANAAPAKPEFAPFIKDASASYAYQDYLKAVPFAAYDMETTPPRRLMIGYVENNAPGGSVDGRYWPPDFNTGDNVDADGPREWFFIYDVAYSATPDPQLQVNILDDVNAPVMWWGTPARRGNVAFAAGDEFLIEANHINTPADVFSFTAPAVTYDATLAKADLGQINVFPNPYYGVNTEEVNKYNRFVTFTHLPQQAILRIFTLAGIQVRELRKDTQDQFLRWDLANESGLPVGSGLYIVHVEMPGLGGATRILKVAIVQEQQVLDRF